ncbi:MAG: AlpA family transcriptional regulator [Pseudomonadota bacterium]
MTSETTNRQFLLSRAEVEARYGITKRFLEVAAVRREGPAMVRIGRSVKYRAIDIEAWIEANRHVPERSAVCQ